MNIQFRNNPETGNIHVDGIADCGKTFSDCAVVLEPHSLNPLLQVSKPLGVQAIRKILDYLEALGKAN